MCTEWLPYGLYSPRPWRVLLNKMCLTLFLGMSNHWLAFYGCTVLMAPVALNKEPSEKTLPMDYSQFLAREHPRSTFHTSKMTQSTFLPIQCVSPNTFSPGKSTVKRRSNTPERMISWHSSCVSFYGASIAWASSESDLCRYRSRSHAHGFLGPLQHGAKTAQVWVGPLL